MAKPIVAKEVLQLTKVGIAPQNIKYNNVNLQSSKYVAVREPTGAPGGKPRVAIVDIANPSKMMFLPVAVDSAIMNPATKVVALRAKESLQIYNLDMKTKMKSTTLRSQVLFWKWLDPKTIAIVTEREVLHWSMDDETPVQQFPRATSEHGAVQILNYRRSNDGKWLILGGIAKKKYRRCCRSFASLFS